jgi:hypothetical protein
MTLDRDSQAVKFVKPDILYRTSLSVCEDHGLVALRGNIRPARTRNLRFRFVER